MTTPIQANRETLIERLRKWAASDLGMMVMYEAADRIEVLSAELTAAQQHIAELEQGLNRVTLALQDELHSRCVSEDMSEEDLIEWLGQDFGRKTIGSLIRLRQAHALLSRHDKGEG